MNYWNQAFPAEHCPQYAAPSCDVFWQLSIRTTVRVEYSMIDSCDGMLRWLLCVAGAWKINKLHVPGFLWLKEQLWKPYTSGATLVAAVTGVCPGFWSIFLFGKSENFVVGSANWLAVLVCSLWRSMLGGLKRGCVDMRYGWGVLRRYCFIDWGRGDGEKPFATWVKYSGFRPQCAQLRGARGRSYTAAPGSRIQSILSSIILSTCQVSLEPIT